MSKWQKFVKRALTTLVGGAVILVMALWAPKVVLHSFFLICGYLGALEYKVIAENMGYKSQSLILAGSVAYGILCLYIDLPFSWLPFLIFGLACLASLYKFDPQKSLPSLGLTVIGATYLSCALVGLAALFSLGPEDENLGRILVLFCFAMVWAGDSFAYMAGTMWGKHKISPNISPKKSVQGTAANFIGNWLAAFVAHKTVLPQIEFQDTFWLALVFGLLGFWGDLVESTWKRSAKIKDSGTIFPGHGGILDRVDSIFLTAPILYVWITWKLNSP